LLTVDPSMRFLFLIFLLFFLLAGLGPAYQKIFSKIVEYFGSPGTAEGPKRAGTKNGLEEMSASLNGSPALYEFEALVLARLAQAGGRGLSLKVLADDLHLDPLLAKKALASLGSQGLARGTRTVFGGRRFFLSGKGREYAMGQGFLPRSQGPYRGKER